MADWKAFTPVPLPETQRSWDSARRHSLELPYCTACRAFHYYPRAVCPQCLSSDLEWRPVSGRGRLHTFSVIHRGPRDFPLGTPYVLAIVELDEGPRLMTNLVGVAADPAAVHIGMPVEVVFTDVNDAMALPHFRPVEDAQ